MFSPTVKLFKALGYSKVSSPAKIFLIVTQTSDLYLMEVKQRTALPTYVMYFSDLLNFFCKYRAEVLLGILTMDSSLL